MSRQSQRLARKARAEIARARAICADEFEPLWKPAAWVGPRAADALERADRQAAAKRAAFAWLGHQLGMPALESFDAIDDLALLRRAWGLIWNATLLDVRRWQDALEAAA
ncbi:MAG TPA: hypothetical protein PKY87_18755 [Terricaulis sp.]|nr:hypothetical protein [Terricaulis sp.]